MITPVFQQPALNQASYEASLNELLKLEFFGMKLGLQNITTLLEAAGRPDRAYKTIHVAGTNGKGSVASMLAAVFQPAGKKVGLYTSPHLVDFRERIKINGEMISRESVRQILHELWPVALANHATFFEVTTALAFKHFANEQVDIAIIETGLGGRLDATNILEHPLATVITSIGWDHMQQLGNSLAEIAAEKAGIFKHGSPAIVNVPVNLVPIFEARTKEVKSDLFLVSNQRDDSIQLPLPGAHQGQNLQTVLETLRHIDNAPTAEQIKYGIEHVGELTGFRSRLERFTSFDLEERGVELLLDVGHNLDAINSIGEYFIARQVAPIVVAGLMKDKDITSVLHEFSAFAKAFVAVQALTPRALDSAELMLRAVKAGMESHDGGDVISGVRQALAIASRGETILIIGSHYVVGEFLANET